MPLTTDLNLTQSEIAGLVSADAVAAFFQNLDYDTGGRKSLTPQSIGLAGDSAAAIKSIELLSEDPEGFLRVVFVQLKSLTARSRNDLARLLGRTNVDHLLVLTKDFGTIEFVLIDKDKTVSRAAGRVDRVQVMPRSITIDRRDPNYRTLRSIRQFSWTCRDGLDQYTTLQIVFRAVPFTEDYFQNRALFADHYLIDRLRDDPAWRENPSDAFFDVQSLLKNARGRWGGQPTEAICDGLFVPLFQKLGFKPHSQSKPTSDDSDDRPDCVLENLAGRAVTAAFVYPWDRWLDGPDANDDRDPERNPGAHVVATLDGSDFNWLVITNGRLWRLYSKETHSRSTNFYEVDLVEALIAAGDTDPNEAFRYWWLFFRAAAFEPLTKYSAADSMAPVTGGHQLNCWLDQILAGSREYARRLGERLKDRIFEEVFRDLAQGFLENRDQRARKTSAPTIEELDDLFEATLTLLYRLLFLLYAESRDLLPIREAAYHQKSLKTIKTEIAQAGGIAASEAGDRLKESYSDKQTGLYSRLCELFHVMDNGSADLNVPTYNGGLFITSPNDSADREHRIGRFLCSHEVPDRYLALAIDRLSRDEDEKTFALVFVDYKSLAVRHLGSIYEGLLEFHLRIATEDLTTETDGKGEKYISLTKARPKRGRQVETIVEKGKVYLSNDKFERKATGSYYTPDPVVKFIVRNTVGRVLDEKLEALRAAFHEASKTFHRELKNAVAHPKQKHDGSLRDPRAFAEDLIFNTHRELVDKLFDFRVLDPAMGSGHFLVEAVDYVTDRLIAFLNRFPNNPVTVTLKRTKQQICEALEKQGISIDERRLTEVNLLKRHVLKRCIYGVDLNPMAVELAKVSLWLDAFTLGAPLSFLDHHLHCGNSLVGLAFSDLKSATSTSLFPIDYVPLLKAINHLLSISRRTDTTALEVKTSSTEYDQARNELSGYQLALNLLTAGYFGVARARDILVSGHDLDWDDQQRFMSSLENDVHRRMVDDSESLAKRPGLRFFHWEDEFPEVFYDVAPGTVQHVRHKNEIAAGSAGFDAIIGNPPYVRMELIKPLKPFLKPKYHCHSERADLFIYFYERAVALLRRGGYSAFIASSTWTKTKSGEGLREFLKSAASVVSFLDFGDLPVFEEATTYPCVMVLRKAQPSPEHKIASAVVHDLAMIDYDSLFRSAIHVSQRELDPTGWRFEDRRLTDLFNKIRSTGIPLKEYCGSPLYGIKTGFNEAFVISNDTREQLVAQDKRSAAILKPFLEGKDLKPWRYEWRGLWLIYTHHGIEIKNYPAVLEYLKTFKSALEGRATSATHEWYDLQQPQFAYTQFMEKPKIMWPQITAEPRFILDEKGLYLNNKIYFVPASEEDGWFLLGVLSSRCAWHVISRIATPKLHGYFELLSGVIEKIPIPAASKSDRGRIAAGARLLSSSDCNDRIATQAELDSQVASLFGLDADDRRVLAGAMNLPTSGHDDEEGD